MNNKLMFVMFMILSGFSLNSGGKALFGMNSVPNEKGSPLFLMKTHITSLQTKILL